MKSWLKHLSAIFVTIWRLRPHMRGGRYLVIIITVTSLCVAVLEIIGVAMLAPLLSFLMNPDNPTGATPMRPIRWLQSWLPGHTTAFYVVIFCALTLGAIGTKNLVYVVSQFLSAKLKRRVSINLRDALYRRIHHAELHQFEQRSAGEMANVFLMEMQRTLFSVDYLVLLLQRCTFALFYLIALLIISWQLTLLTIFLAGIIGGMVALFYRQLTRSGRELSELNQKIGSLLVETFGGIRVIRATHSQAREIERFNQLSAAHARVEERSMRANSLLLPIAETIAVAGALVIVGCAYLFLVKPKLMLPSYLLVFGFILLRLLPLLNQIYGLQGHVFYLSSAASEVQKWIDLPQYPQRAFGNVEFTGVREAVRFEQVGYTYPNGTRALEGMTFDIPAGKMVALVGASGSGKSTVATLLLRLRQPTEGGIRVDGRDYWEFSAESWHRSIGVVEQEAFLFHDTMARNIAYGCEGVATEAIDAAVKMAHLEDLVQSLPEHLNTMVGERGTMLSGGQRQRLAIARALVRDPRILILDEATSALDSISEQQVQAALETAQRGRTVLVIAHRFSTIQRADKIVVMKEGRFVEQGSWAELVERKTLFWSLLNAGRGHLA